MKKIIIYFRLFLWLILAIFVVWAIWQMASPDGKIVYQTDFKSKSAFIADFEPDSRTVRAPDKQVVFGDLAYFKIYSPRSFNKLKLTFRYRPGSEDLIEIGLLKNPNHWQYEIKPLFYRQLNQFYRSGDWGVIQSGQTMLMQRQEKYDSLNSFFKKLPDSKTIATYNYNWADKKNQPLEDGRPLGKQINYIVANYRLPKVVADDLYESQVEFDLTNATYENGYYKIMIRVPGLKNKTEFLELGDLVEIKTIKAELEGSTWRDFLKI